MKIKGYTVHYPAKDSDLAIAKAKRMLAAGRSLAVISTSLREAGRKCSCKGATKTRAGGWCPAVRNFLARSSR